MTKKHKDRNTACGWQKGDKKTATPEIQKPPIARRLRICESYHRTACCVSECGVMENGERERRMCCVAFTPTPISPATCLLTSFSPHPAYALCVPALSLSLLSPAWRAVHAARTRHTPMAELLTGAARLTLTSVIPSPRRPKAVATGATPARRSHHMRLHPPPGTGPVSEGFSYNATQRNGTTTSTATPRAHAHLHCTHTRTHVTPPTPHHTSADRRPILRPSAAQKHYTCDGHPWRVTAEKQKPSVMRTSATRESVTAAPR